MDCPMSHMDVTQSSAPEQIIYQSAPIHWIVVCRQWTSTLNSKCELLCGIRQWTELLLLPQKIHYKFTNWPQTSGLCYFCQGKQTVNYQPFISPAELQMVDYSTVCVICLLIDQRYCGSMLGKYDHMPTSDNGRSNGCQTANTLWS